MADIEKYIEVLSKTVKTVKELNEDTPIKISLECVEDILELLKEQEDLGTELTNAVELIHKKNERIEKLLKEREAVEPTWQQGKAYCGSCGKRIPLKIGARFCHKCGRSVEWNE